MTTYGYRLFFVELRDGHGRTGLELEEPFKGSAHAKSLLVDALRQAKGQVRIGNLKYEALEDLTRRRSIEELVGPWPGTSSGASDVRPYVRVEDVIDLGSRVDVFVRYGREADFDTGIRADGGTDVPLKGVATTRAYRLVFYFPVTGKQAVLIAETRGRTHVGETLLKLLSVRAWERSVESDTDTSKQWFRWLPKPITDPARVAQVLEEGHGVDVTLTKKQVQSQGGRSSDKLVLRQNGIPVQQLPRLQDIVLGWVGAKPTDSKKQQAASDLAVLFEEPAVGDLGFTDGEVTFTERGKVQTITPSNVERIFVYPLGDKFPTDEELVQSAVSRLRDLTTAAKVDIDFGNDGRG